MRYLRWLTVGVLIALCGCTRATLNVGSPFHGHPRLPGITLSPPQPAGGYIAGTTVTATVSYQSVLAITFTLSFPNGGATPTTQTFLGPANMSAASAQFAIDPFLLVDDPDGKDISFRVTGVDESGVSGEMNGTFHVVGIPCQPVVINNATVSGTTVIVDTSQPSSEDVTVTWSATNGFTGMPQSATIDGGNGTAAFSFSAPDLIAGGAADITFTAWDNCAPDLETVTVIQSPLALALDTLYAIPLQTTINAGEPVRIVVASGDPANPFFYMTGVRVTAPAAADFNYVAGSFNAGAVGGSPGDPDGIWTDQGATSFLLPPDNFIQRNFVIGPDPSLDRHAIDFNLTPLDGSDMAVGEGELFNFEATFGAAGTWQLGFQDVNVVNRTYYQDSLTTPDYFWGDITNSHAGIPNSVTVN